MNVLVIRMHRFGDILQLTPMLQGFKKKYSDCRITFFTSCEMADLLADNPDVDEIISIPEKRYRYYLKNKPEYYARIYNEMYDLVSDLKRRKFQMIINRHYEFGGILAYLIGAGQILGQIFSPERGFFLNDPISTQLHDTILTNRKINRRNLVDWACHIAGVPPGCGDMAFYIQETDRWEADALLMAGGVREDESPVAVQMGAARSFRQWGSENYVRVISWLTQAKEKRVVLLGSEDERDLAEAVLDNLGQDKGHVVDLIGKTTLKTLGGVLERCRYLITGDTGTMHMAASVGTPVIALFYGTAYPWETGPYGTGHLVLYADEPCAPCLNPEDCAFGHRCRKAIKPEHVCRAFKIAEGLSDNECNAYTWGTDKVRLFITLAHPGYDQVLIPIEEMNRGIEFGPFPRKPQRRELSKVKILETGVGRLLNKGEEIARQFYLGNMQGFLEAVPEYVDQWSKIVAFFDKGEFGHINPKVLEHHLAPALDQACQAMEAEDYVTVVDLIRYRFEPILESVIQEIKKNR